MFGITPYRARTDPEPVGEFGARPDLALLQQPEQGGRPLGRAPLITLRQRHVTHPAKDGGPILSAMGVRLLSWTQANSV